MNKWFIIGGAVVILLLGVGGYFFFHKTPTVVAPGGDTTLPSGGAVTLPGPTRSFIASDGKNHVTAHDFTLDTDVVVDPNVPDQYDLAGGIYADQSTSYQIFYQTTDDYFGITLYKEPLKATRAAAELELKARLGISEADMCKLNYVVAPGPGVNEAYAGENLGFSFCPGAIKLP